jgi:hypothetical protein
MENKSITEKIKENKSTLVDRRQLGGKKKKG